MLACTLKIRFLRMESPESYRMHYVLISSLGPSPRNLSDQVQSQSNVYAMRSLLPRSVSSANWSLFVLLFRHVANDSFFHTHP